MTVSMLLKDVEDTCKELGIAKERLAVDKKLEELLHNYIASKYTSNITLAINLYITS